MSTPTSPGWYDDPQDPSLLRYFDGIVWTRHTTPRAGIAADPQPSHGGTPSSTATEGESGRDAAAGEQGQPPLNPYGVPTYRGHPSQGQPPRGYPPPGQQPSGQQPPGQQPSGQQPHDPWAPPPGGRPGPPYQQPPGFQYPMAHRGPATPDGVPMASYGQRVGAWFLDGLIKLVISLVLGGWAIYLAVKPQMDAAFRAAERGETVPLDLTGRDTNLHWMAVYLVIWGVVGLAYSMFFLTRRGATPGKSALGISIRRLEHAGPLDARTAAVRYLIPFANAVLGVAPVLGTIVSLLWAVDHLLPLMQPRRQAIHDLMAGTVVVIGPQPPR